MARERAIGYGYIISDGSGGVKLETLRPTRKDCWSVFLEDKEPRITKAKMKVMGYRAIPVFVRETCDVQRGEKAKCK
jgi:hypothetical protein